jgi:hypothetical protein
MKQIKKLVVLAAVALLCAIPKQAAAATTNQALIGTTNTPILNSVTNVVNEQGFLQTAFGFFTSFNASLSGPSGTFGTNGAWQINSGTTYQQGLNLGATLGAQATPFASVPWLALGEVSTFGGVVGTVYAEEADIGWNYVYQDVDVTAGLCGADIFHQVGNYSSGLRGGIFLQFEKGLTQNTFIGVRLSNTWGKGRGEQPPVGIFAGFTFGKNSKLL